MSDSIESFRQQLLTLEPKLHSPEASVWVTAASGFLFEVLGEDCEIARQLSEIRFSPFVRRTGGRPPPEWDDRFEYARQQALGLLVAAGAKQQRLKPDPPTICALHPIVESVSLGLFEDGHFAEAVEAAFKEVDVRVQRLAQTDKGIFGVTAMGKAFDGSPPVLMINSLESANDENEQKGFAFIFKGAMQGIRNPKAHANVRLDDADRANNYLGLASLLMRRLDDAEARLGSGQPMR